MARLAVNVDHVATLRQARGGNQPDPAAAAPLVEIAGADGVVIHLREDRRHINDRDARLIRQLVKTKLILEMAATPEMVGMALELRPHQVTLVPERRQEITTEGGLDVAGNEELVTDTIKTLHGANIQASLFIDPDLNQIKRAHKVNADTVEIHTGAFCDADTQKLQSVELEKIRDAARLAHKLGLIVHAGHGIDYQSIKSFFGMGFIDEFSIGHAIISKAVFVGLHDAVVEMADLVKKV